MSSSDILQNFCQKIHKLDGWIFSQILVKISTLWSNLKLEFPLTDVIHVTYLVRVRVLQEVDPLTALKYAVQVMNFLNLLIERALRQRQQDQKKKQPK